MRFTIVNFVYLFYTIVKGFYLSKLLSVTSTCADVLKRINLTISYKSVFTHVISNLVSTETKENVCMIIDLNSWRISWGNQHSCRSFVLGQQNGRRDVTVLFELHGTHQNRM